MTTDANVPTTQTEHGAAHGVDDLHVHVVPIRTLLAVFGALIVFTGLTVAVRYVDLGDGNIVLALTIAAIKAGLVALYFMHLRYDRPFHGIILVGSLCAVALFIGTVLVDTQEYADKLEPPPPSGIIGKP